MINPAVDRNSGQMRGSIVPDRVYIDLERKDITLPVWNLNLDSPAWHFRRSRRDGQIWTSRQGGLFVGVE
jgi:hypothetical protein